MPISRISHKDIQAYSDSLVGAVTHNERRSRLVYLKQILTAAAKPDVDGHSIIQRSPFDIKIPAFHQSEESAPATPEELRIIHDAMPEHLRLAITLAIAAGGLRIGEVCGLQRQDIDIERHTISIRRTRLDDIPGIIVGDTKTPGSRRTEPLPESVIPEIEEHLRKWVQRRTGGMDLPRHPRPSRRPRRYPNHMQRTQIPLPPRPPRAGRADLRFHDLRATALTMLAQQGATVRELMAAAGHTTPTMAIHYQRTTEKDGGRSPTRWPPRSIRPRRRRRPSATRKSPGRAGSPNSRRWGRISGYSKSASPSAGQCASSSPSTVRASIQVGLSPF